MHEYLKDIFTLVSDLLFPKTCLICDRGETFVCAICAAKLKKVEHQICIVCHKASLMGITHPGCARKNIPDGLYSVYDYTDPNVSKLLIDGKYKFLPELYTTLGELLTVHIKADKLDRVLDNFTTTPIPLVTKRLRWRGFNQAELLAQSLSAILQNPYEQVLVRYRSTKTQKDLSKVERTKNIINAFGPRNQTKSWATALATLLFEFESPPPAIPQIKDSCFILVDDVITTGSTLLEATKLLKQHGARKVWCITLARD
jgi:predicted amidophosphoribosyltransferase